MFSIEKFAAKITNMEAFEAKLSDDHKEDRELIKRVQMYNDKFAMKKLAQKYRGAIRDSVIKSNLHSVMDRDIAEEFAQSAFKEIIKNQFDLNEAVQPNTPIVGRLKSLLLKEKNRHSDMISRKSEELQHANRYFSTANKFLKNELNRDPSDDEIFDFANTHFGQTKGGNQKLTKDHIRKLRERNVTELSGNVQLGGKEDSNAEYITLGDVKNVGRLTPQEIFNNSMHEYKVNRVIDQFNRQERTFIRQYLGLGEFKGKPTKSLNEAATSNLLSNYQAKIILQRLKGLISK